MNTDTALHRAQVYRFLADAFLYPSENWLDDLPLLDPILRDLAADNLRLETWALSLAALQTEHRRAFGVTGSLCYETECGLPHEFRQSQELADIAGFYRAFGFTVGGPVRERPDHLAVELEFMHVLALKEAYAAERGIAEHVEICADAQRKFLQDHLGRWIGLFAESLTRTTADSPYRALAGVAAAFVKADAEHLGVQPEQRRLTELKPTPLGPEISCEACPIAE